MSLTNKRSGSAEPLDKGSDAYRSLRAKLLAHGFLPYVQLNIRDVAENLGVSSTPVREALVRLADEGIIQFKPGRGFFTKPLNFQDIYADFEMEKMVLRYSLSKSVQTFPVFDLPAPANGDLMEHSERAIDERAERYASFITDLHSKIALSSGNEKLHEFMSRCCDRLHRVRIIDFHDPARLGYVARGLMRLLGSLARRNLSDTMTVMDDLFAASIDQIDRVVRDGNAWVVQAHPTGELFPRMRARS